MFLGAELQVLLIPLHGVLHLRMQLLEASLYIGEASPELAATVLGCYELLLRKG